MRSELKKLSRQTVGYTGANLLYRGASFILVPLYAHQLAASEYGTLELITTTVYLIQSLFTSGITHAALRFYYEYDSTEEQRAFISTAFIGSLVLSFSLAGMIAVLAPYFSHMLFQSYAYTFPFQLMALLMALEIPREMSLAFVRAKERIGLFTILSLVQLFTQVGVTVYTVVVLKMGLVGVLISQVAATAMIWLVLTVFTVYHAGVRFQPKRLVPLIRYSAPMMLSTLGWTGFQYLDRYALGVFASLTSVGMYAFALRMASIIPTLVVVPFTNSYGPFRFSIMKQANAPQVYARVTTYYIFAAAFAVLGIASLSRELLRFLAQSEYWPAYSIIPIVVIPGAMGGLQYCLQTGIYIEKKTKHLFYVAFFTGLVNVALVALLIPRFGMLGAAFALLGSAIYGVSHTWAIGQKIYPVPYEYGRVAKIISIAVVLGVAGFYLPIDNLAYALLAKGLLIALFPILALLWAGLAPEEREVIKRFWGRASSGIRTSLGYSANPRA